MKFVALAVCSLINLVAMGVLSAQQTVVRLVVPGPVTLGTNGQFTRALEVANEEASRALVIELRGNGGRVDLAQLMTGGITESAIPIFVLVAGDVRGAAPMILAFASDSLYFEPGATLGLDSENVGAAWEETPADRATRQLLKNQMAQRGIPDATVDTLVDGRPVDDGEQGVIRGTLTAERAVELGAATDTVVDVSPLLEAHGWSKAELIDIESSWTGTTIVVTNRNWRDVRVFVSRGGSRWRLGTITSMNSQEFEIPGRQLVSGAVIRLIAELIGSPERISTDRIRVEPGLVIEWVIELNVPTSSYQVWIR